jgi:hypothetical protein
LSAGWSAAVYTASSKTTDFLPIFKNAWAYLAVALPIFRPGVDGGWQARWLQGENRSKCDPFYSLRRRLAGIDYEQSYPQFFAQILGTTLQQCCHRCVVHLMQLLKMSAT